MKTDLPSPIHTGPFKSSIFNKKASEIKHVHERILILVHFWSILTKARPNLIQALTITLITHWQLFIFPVSVGHMFKNSFFIF